MVKKKSMIVEDKKVPEKTYTCYCRFDKDPAEIVCGGVKNGVALELSATPTVFNLDNKKRIKHVGSMEFTSPVGKKFTLFLSEDKSLAMINKEKLNG